MWEVSSWGDAGEKNYLSGGEKEVLMSQIVRLRDSPSQELFNEREAKLLDNCKALSIRPGQVGKPVEFPAYYQKK